MVPVPARNGLVYASRCDPQLILPQICEASSKPNSLVGAQNNIKNPDVQNQRDQSRPPPLARGLDSQPIPPLLEMEVSQRQDLDPVTVELASPLRPGHATPLQPPRSETGPPDASIPSTELLRGSSASLPKGKKAARSPWLRRCRKSILGWPLCAVSFNFLTYDKAGGSRVITTLSPKVNSRVVMDS